MSAADAEHGYTLIELLIAIIVSAVIYTVIAAAFTISIGSTNETTDRLLEANAANGISSYFTQDIQSATAISTTVRRCTSNTTGDLVASMVRADVNLDYVFFQGSGGTGQIVRRVCSAGERSVASELVKPVVVCLPTPDCVSAAAARLTLQLAGEPASVTATRRHP